MSTTISETRFVQAMSLNELKESALGGSPHPKTVHLNGHTIVLWYVGGQVFAVDNRCPHMGFPLERGTVNDGILTCHWHHARFDLESGGTFDQFADDVRAFPVEIRDGEIWVDITQHDDPRQHQRERLRVGLERNIPLVLGKAILVLLEDGGDPIEPFRLGLDFGTRYRRGGWRQGLTMLTCFMNMLPYLEADDRPRALYHGLSAVARESFGEAPRFPIRPLPHSDHTDIPMLKRWFRQFVAVRDDEGAERCIVSAIRAGADAKQMADILFTTVTDYRFVDIGHPADFTNKAFEALDIAGWEYAEPVLTSLVSDYARGSRMEEANAWRHPVDLVAILEETFAKLPLVVETGQSTRFENGGWNSRDDLLVILHGDNPRDIVEAMLAELQAGCPPTELAAIVSYAAALRIARFHTSNEFPDWDTALHTFSFANAIEQGLRRAPSVELLRGVFDAAMCVYLDRFLNIPAARIPQPNGKVDDPMVMLLQLPPLLDRQQQVNEVADMVMQYLHNGGSPEKLLAMMGKVLLREDRDFHTIQTVEGAFRQYVRWQGTEAGTHALIAAARYLAAHAPTVRAQGQTYDIAHRLNRGERLFEP
jgi:nitrite reductase/ring-hydroxylating ferredoxin subunit